MALTFYILITIAIVTSILSLVPLKHWIFRVCDFLKIHIVILLLIALCLSIWVNPKGILFLYLSFLR